MEKISESEKNRLESQGSLFLQVSYTQIRSFHAVAFAGGFTAASKILHVGQPTITSQVRALEEYYGIELFFRRGRRVELTPLGGCPRISVSGFLNPGLACRSHAQVGCCP